MPLVGRKEVVSWSIGGSDSIYPFSGAKSLLSSLCTPSSSGCVEWVLFLISLNVHRRVCGLKRTFSWTSTATEPKEAINSASIRKGSVGGGVH